MRLEEIISRRSQCLHDIWIDTCCLDGTSITCCGPNVISSSRSRRYNRDKKLVVACSALQAQLKLVVALQAFTTSELCVTRLVVGPVWSLQSEVLAKEASQEAAEIGNDILGPCPLPSCASARLLWSEGPRMSLPISAASRDATFAKTSLWRLHAAASAPSAARVGLGVGLYAVESETTGLSRVKGRLT